MSGRARAIEAGGAGGDISQASATRAIFDSERGIPQWPGSLRKPRRTLGFWLKDGFLLAWHAAACALM
jgi:hypothetical protein